MKVLQFGLLLLVAVVSVNAKWCLWWCPKDAVETTEAPVALPVVAENGSTVFEPTSTTAIPNPSSEPATTPAPTPTTPEVPTSSTAEPTSPTTEPTTDTTTTTPAPTTPTTTPEPTTTTTTPEPTTTTTTPEPTTTTTTPEPTTTTAVVITTPSGPITQAPIILNSNTSPVPDVTPGAVIPTPTSAPKKSINLNPFSLVSKALGVVGSSIQTTSDALTSVLTFPFKLFGVKGGQQGGSATGLGQCFVNMIFDTNTFVKKVANMIPSCSVQLSGNLMVVSKGMQTLGDNLIGDVVSSWRYANCKVEEGFSVCMQKIVNLTAVELQNTVTELSNSASAAMPLVETVGSASFVCLMDQMKPVLDYLPTFVKSLDCLAFI